MLSWVAVEAPCVARELVPMGLVVMVDLRVKMSCESGCLDGRGGEGANLERTVL